MGTTFGSIAISAAISEKSYEADGCTEQTAVWYSIHRRGLILVSCPFRALQRMRYLHRRSCPQLHAAALLIPKTAEERNLLVKELRIHKKELQLRKREATAAATAIREEARTQSAYAGKTWLGLYDSGLAAAQRRRIRYAKEAALHPHEDVKASIQRQQLHIDQDLLWLDRLS